MRRVCEILQGLGVLFTLFWASGADSMDTLTLVKGMAIGIALILAGYFLDKLTNELKHKRN